MWSSDNHRLLSQPIRIHWAGWETNTLALQQAGWSLSAEQDMMRQQLRVAMRHEGYGVRGLTGGIDFDYRSMSKREHEYLRHVVLPAQLASRFQINTMERFPSMFQPIDALPQISTAQRMSLDDYAHFAVPLATTREIIVPEPSVSDLLARILEMQEPAKNRYFKELVESEREGRSSDAGLQRKFHAQIVSLAA